MIMTEKTTHLIPSILLALVVLSTIASTRTSSALAGSIGTSGMLPQPYTSSTFADPALSSVDTNASRALVETLLNNTLQGTGTAADGTVALPHAEPPSLLVTRDVVEALITLDGSVPNAPAIASWVWSRWHSAGGYFDDEYSMNWSVLQDGTGWIAANRYSPVVATACALDILSMLDQPVAAVVNESIRAFILSCHESLTGKFKGKQGTVEPTLQDAVWAIRALWLMGRLNNIDTGTCAAYIVSLRGTDGLYQFHDPAVTVPASEYLGGTIPVTRLAIEALQQLGRLGTIDLPTAQANVMVLYDVTGKHFHQDPYSPSRTALATADALRLFTIVGFPAGFVAGQIPAIVEEYSRKQLPGGGWGAEDGSPLAVTEQIARVVTELVKVAGTTGTIDLAKIRSAFASSLTSNPGTGMAAYCPYPANHPVFPATVALTLLAQGGGMVNTAAEAPARRLVSASSADGSGTYPRKYPGAGSLAYMPAGEFLTFGTGGIVTLAARVALKDAMSVPFTQADLNEIALLLSQIQYKSSSIPGIQGLCLTRHDISPIIGLPGVNPRVASLENTLAAARIINTLRGYGNGTWFVPGRFLDLGLLYGRLASAYRESGTVAWFEREYPANFQQPSGLDNAKLRDTRLAIEIIFASHGFSHATITATVNLAKVANLALNEPRKTVTDIDNAAAILAMINATTTLPQRIALISQVQLFKVASSAWYCRAGLPSIEETIKAFAILSRFSGISAALGHVLVNGTSVEAIAGTRVPLSCTLSNCFAGPGVPGTFYYSIAALAISCNNTSSPTQITVPLQEATLGPATINVSTSGASLSGSISISITVTGILYLPHVDGRVVITTPGRAPFTAVLDLRLVNPDDTTQQAPVHNASVSAAGLSIDHDAFFAVDGAPSSSRYQTVLHVNPLVEETLYRLVVTHDYCKGLDIQLAVRCADNLSYSPAIMVPLSGISAGALLLVAAKRQRKRVKVTMP